MFEAMSMPNIGFKVTFANGYEMSVQWGRMNYCSKMHKPNDDLNCKNVEIAIFDTLNNGENVTKNIFSIQSAPSGNYATFVTPEEYAGMTAFVASIKR